VTTVYESSESALCVRRQTVIKSHISEHNQSTSAESLVQPLGRPAVSSAERCYPKYERPSLAVKERNNLTACAGIIKGKTLQTRDTDLEKTVSNFVNLYHLEWNRKYHLLLVHFVGIANQTLLPHTE